MSQQDLTSSAQTTAAASCPVCSTVCKTTTEHDNNNDNKDDKDNMSSSLITVARSWIGALVAVMLFLGVFLYVRNQ